MIVVNASIITPIATNNPVHSLTNPAYLPSTSVVISYNKPVDEQREYQRRVFFSDAYLIINGRQPIKARTWDISNKGMSVIMSENLKPTIICMIRFEIFIDIENIQNFEVEAQIIHCYFKSNSGFVVCIRFIRPPARLKDTLAVFLSR